MANRDDVGEAFPADAEFWKEQMGMSPPRPDWDETNLKVWVEWANWILDHGCQDDLTCEPKSDYSEYEDYLKCLEAEQIEEKTWLAEVEQLRNRYPQFASRLHISNKPRRLGRLPKHSYSNNKDPEKTKAAYQADINAQLAAVDIENIRALYRQYFNKRNRPANLPPHPEDIAAARWDADVEMVRERKRRGFLKMRAR